MNAGNSPDDFIDSNVLVYLFDETDLEKYHRARVLVNRLVDDKSGCISYQVVQETLNVITTKLGISHRRVVEFMDETLAPLWQIDPSSELYLRALELRERYGFSFYDSLIVAAALEAGCTRLYTEDMQHGQQIHGLTIENPFISAIA